MNISTLSIKELKALLARVESDLADIDNEHKICNNIAKSFTGKQYNRSEEHTSELQSH